MRGKLRRRLSATSSKGQSLWRKQMFVYIYEDFAINCIRPKILILLLTGKILKCGTEGSGLKNICKQ